MTSRPLRLPVAPPAAVARPASTPEVWRALHWTVLDSARRGSFWVTVAGGLTLLAVVEQYLSPGHAPWVTLLVVPSVVVGHALVVLGAALLLVRRHDVLLAADGSAMIALRHSDTPGGRVLRLTDHVARRVGDGSGRRLRAALAPHLADHVAAAGITTVRLTGITPAMTERYAAELLSALPGVEITRHGRSLEARLRGPDQPGTAAPYAPASSITPSTS